MRNTLLSMFLGAGLVGAFACASGGAAGRAAGCIPHARDSVYAGPEPAYRECAVDTRAKLTDPGPRPDFRAPSTRNACYFAELEFVVDAKGRPELGTATVLRTNERTLGEAELATLAGWKYEPAVRAGKAVRQIIDERKTVSTYSVLVPAGSSPPSGPPAGRRQNC